MTDEQWEQLKQLIWNAEQSGGDYTSHNKSSGAAGAYQFMPETWREKANTYGYGEYADVPNATYAPPYVQDSVARGWATDLYKKYNGDVRYVLDAGSAEKLLLTLIMKQVLYLQIGQMVISQ